MKRRESINSYRSAFQTSTLTFTPRKHINIRIKSLEKLINVFDGLKSTVNHLTFCDYIAFVKTFQFYSDKN